MESMSPFGPAFVILPTRTLPTLLDEPRQLDELAENIGLASQELWKFKRAPHPDRYMCPNLPYFMPRSGLLNTHVHRFRASVILSHHVLPCCGQISEDVKIR